MYVAQTYDGTDPAQMEGFIANYCEYHFLYITGIELVESKSIQRIGLITLWPRLASMGSRANVAPDRAAILAQG